MAQAGLNDEKNWRAKISLDCPFEISTFKIGFAIEKRGEICIPQKLSCCCCLSFTLAVVATLLHGHLVYICAVALCMP